VKFFNLLAFSLIMCMPILAESDRSKAPTAQSKSFVLRLLEALNGPSQERVKKPDTQVAAQIQLTQNKIDQKKYTIDGVLKSGQKIKLNVFDDRYDLQHYLKTNLSNGLQTLPSLTLQELQGLVGDAIRNAPVLLLGYSIRQKSPTDYSIILRDLPLKKVNVLGPKDKATSALISIIKRSLDRQPFTSRYKLQNLIKKIKELPGYRKAGVKLDLLESKDAASLTIQLRETEEHQIGYSFKNDLSTKLGPINNTFSFVADNAFMDHDRLLLYTLLSQEPKNLWGAGFDYTYLLTDTGVRHGISVSRFNIDPEGLDVNRNLSTKNHNYATYLIIPLYQDLTDELIFVPKLDQSRGSTNSIQQIAAIIPGNVNFLNRNLKSIQTNFTATLTYKSQDTWGGKNDLNLRYKKGLGLTIDKARDSDRSNLSAWSILLGYERKQNLGNGISVTPSFDVQWADKDTGPNQSYNYGSKKIERAYRSHQVQGQSGIRSGIQISYMDFIYSYYSYGRIKNHANNEGTTKEEVTSTAVGLNVPLFQYLFANVEYAIPLKRRTIYADGKHRNKLFVSVSGRWKF